ncbi:MAG: FHA domain-containing protein [Anaerolineales bacterium]
MIICPNCKHEAIDGTIFCLECGAHLVSVDSRATQTIQTSGMSGIKEAIRVTEPPAIAARTWATLHLIESGQLIPLGERKEYTLGRVNEGQPVTPDIDLNPYHAFENGVSRLHAVIKHSENRTIIIDLGSSNGTFVNGVRLAPQIETPLKNGDLIALGKLKFQILLSYI